MMRILATVADVSACGYYRISLPLTDLNLRHGHRTQITTQLPMDPRDPIYDVDVFIVQRIVDPDIAHFLKTDFREHHPDAVVIYEIDDLVTELHPENFQAWEYYQGEGRLDIFKDLVSSVDAVTTTTERLAGRLRELNPHVYALDNALPNWIRGINMEPHDGPVRIVYTGGASHIPDVRKHKYGIGRTVRQLGDRVTMTCFGHPWMQDLGLGGNERVQFRPWVHDFPTYQAALVGYDIGIAPLEWTPFNDSKSAIKVYEYWAAGIVPVVSDVGPYVDAIEDGVDGFLCRTDDQWRKALMKLVNEPELLAKMREAGQARVDDLQIGRHSHEWETAYNEVLERHRRGRSCGH